MHIRSVNVSLPRTVIHDHRAVTTGIFKEPVPGRVRVHRRGLEGDGQADLENHGGDRKTVYAYPFEHYAHWAGVLKRQDFQYGQFGENLTVEGLLEDQVRIGDVFRAGTCLLQVAQPRKPCFKLGIRMDSPKFVQLFMNSGRVGFYMRVVQEGELGAGDRLELVEPGPFPLSVRRLWQLAYFEEEGFDEARQALRFPHLSPEWRRPLALRLKKAGIPLEE